jgi:hypothetical protein
MFQYHIKVVGTEFVYLNGSSVNTNQFSVTENERDISPQLGGQVGGIPGIFMNYDISPMRVINTESQKAFAHFLTDGPCPILTFSVCAIVGGIVTIAGLLDAFIYNNGRGLGKNIPVPLTPTTPF